ncbi:restriction endonuclease subunit S [Microbacterium sp. YY-03]|uniref:restriction endonuclease subunit S n=1 Tax=Microbacterium sp. YY-03 TaxID=3421636 RepID=UPI003D1625E3
MTAIIWPGAAELPQLPFKRLFTPVKRAPTQGAHIVTAYTDGQVTLRSNRAKVGYHEAADTSTYIGVRKGDFVVHGLDIMRGSVGVSDSDGVISPVCTVCLPTHLIEPRYAAYAMRLQAASGFPKALARGVREGGADFRRWDTLAELPLPVPPVDHQRAIADYLDRETAQIDAFIAKNEELIALLTERRSATITELILRGVDRSAVLRESGVEGMGRIPIHWGVQPIVTLARVLTSTIDKKSYPGEQPVRLCNYTDVYYSESINSDVGFMAATATREQIKKFSVREGDVPFTKDSESSDDIGISSYVSRDLPGVVYGYHLGIYRPADMRSGKYIKYLLDTTYVKDYFLRRTPGVTRVGLAQSVVRYLRSPVPPMHETLAIVTEIERVTGALDVGINLASEAIKLSRERRAALISATVTGKINVRKAS